MIPVIECRKMLTIVCILALSLVHKNLMTMILVLATIIAKVAPNFVPVGMRNNAVILVVGTVSNHVPLLVHRNKL